MVNIRKVLLTIISMTMLSACSSAWDIEGVSRQEAKGTLFDKALKHEYTELASIERDRGDWGDSATFLARARLAADGHSPVPEQVADRTNIPDNRKPEALAARARLMRSLDVGARSKMPEEAAWAQAGYECITEELDDGAIKEKELSICKEKFENAMDLLERNSLGSPETIREGQYMVYFAFGKANLEGDANLVIKEAVRNYRRLQPSYILVGGYADTVGSFKANAALSRHRARAVSNALNKAGIPAEKIRIEAYGKYNLAIPTADNTREPRNRRVTLTFQK